MQITINLLPPEQKNIKIQRKLNEKLVTISFIIIITIIGLTALLFTYTATQKEQLSSINNNIEQEKKQLDSSKNIRLSISQISNTASYIDMLGKKGIDWNKFINKFSSLIPERCKITSIKANSVPDKSLEISGQAKTRKDVIDLFEKMKETDFISDTQLKNLDQSGSTNNQVSDGFGFTISAKIITDKL